MPKSIFDHEDELALENTYNAGLQSQPQTTYLQIHDRVDTAVARYFSLRGQKELTKIAEQPPTAKVPVKTIPKKLKSPAYIYTSSDIIQRLSPVFSMANIHAYERSSQNWISVDSKTCIVLFKLSEMFQTIQSSLLDAASKFSIIHILLEFDSVYQDSKVQGVYPFTFPNNCSIGDSKGFIFNVLEQELGCKCHIWYCFNLVQVVDKIARLSLPFGLEKEESIQETFLVGFPGMNNHLANIMLKKYSLKEICQMNIDSMKLELEQHADHCRLELFHKLLHYNLNR
ncbi:hypothetical protein HDV01_006733 [Terramyces sp. JEL0728]|nr:hypothetical protein HDV01_006733 [Terramyces sp. JEL0728]